MLFHGFYILSAKPLIISFIGNIQIKGQIAIDVSKNQSYGLPTWFKPKYVLNHIGGWSAPWQRMGGHKLRQFSCSSRGVKHHLLVNADDEDIVRKRLLVKGAHFNHNIFVNEHLYKPLDESKKYDAVYTAQLKPFKRLSLAQKVERLMIISYGGDLHKFCPELKHADFNQEFLPREELVRLYNRSYAGLCLSEVEGAMFASCEYLLSGIPVVSTPSKGGRDEFFTSKNSLIIPAEPEAVFNAVQLWKNNPPDPYSIREEALQNIRKKRLGYCLYISNLIEKYNGQKINPEKLMEVYFSSRKGIDSRFVKLDDVSKCDLDKFIIS